MRIQRLAVIFSLMGAGIIFIATSLYGAGLTPDSVGYISSADSLLSGNGYTVYDGRPMVQWPPLFPTLLAVFGLVGIETSVVARVINILAFGLTIYFSARLLRMHLRSNGLVVLGAAAVLLSLPLITVSQMVWTEPLFVLLSVLFLIYLPRFLKGQSLIHLLLISIIAALSFLQRYSGITLALTGVVSIGLVMRGISWQQRAGYVTAFSAIAILPMVAWVARNYTLTSTFTGERSPSMYSLHENVLLTLNVFASWLVHAKDPFPIPLLVTAISALLLAALIVILRRFKLDSSDNNGDSRLEPLNAVAIFVGMYVLFVVVSSTTTAFDRINFRLMVPVYVCVIVLLFAFAEKLSYMTSWLTSQKHSTAKYWLMLGIFLVLVGIVFNERVLAEFIPSTDGVVSTATRVNIITIQVTLVVAGILLIAFRSKEWLGRVLPMGICAFWIISALPSVYLSTVNSLVSGAGGYNTITWRESPLIEWLRTNPLEGKVYSNSPDAIYILIGRSATIGPRERLSDPAKCATEPPSFSPPFTLSSNTYLVWFDNSHRDYPLNVEELRRDFDLEAVTTRDDGAVYSVTGRRSC